MLVRMASSNRFSATLFCIAVLEVFLFSGGACTTPTIAQEHMRQDVDNFKKFPSKGMLEVNAGNVGLKTVPQVEAKLQMKSHDLEVAHMVEDVKWWPSPGGGIPPVKDPPIPQEFHTPGHCIMSGRAGGSTSASIPFAYDGPAFTSSFSFAPGCGEFEKLHCCDETQYNDLIRSLTEAQTVFGSCPACVQNFKTMFCYMTCSPDQAVFNERIRVQTKDNHTAMKEGHYHVHPEFVEALFDSCKDVELGASGQTVMNVVFGAFTAREFLNAVEDNSPYDLKFVVDENGVKPPYKKCSESCSCNDCKPVCAPPPAPPVKGKSCMVGKIHCRTFILIISYFIICVLMSIFVLCFKLFGGKFKNRTSEIVRHLESKAHSVEQSHAGSGLLSNFFQNHGRWVAQVAPLIIIVSLVFAIGLSFGIFRIKFITEPEKLWSTSTSRTAKDKSYFDDHFGPFYRTNQVIITRKDGREVVNFETFLEVFELEEAIRNTSFIGHDGKLKTMEDLCFKPILGKGCSLESPLEYFQEDIATLYTPPGSPPRSVWEQVYYCADLDHLTNKDCRSSIGAITLPNVVFGGYSGSHYANSTAMMFTYLLNNHEDDDKNKDAEKWEKYMLGILEARKFKYINVYYYCERSVQDEIDRESKSDVPTIAISYCVMLCYVILALGELLSFNPKRMIMQPRLFVALSGILVVILSVSSSMGFCALVGIKATLIISEVIPFLVLAIGTDNVFIITHAFDRTDPDKSISERMGDALSIVGSSITCAALSETFAFLLGVLTRMPAVCAFSYYTAVAVFFDFILQLGAFAAALSLNERRASWGLYEVFPIPIVRGEKYRPKEGYVHKFMRKFYVPAILHPYVRIPIILIFIAFFFVALNFIPQMSRGLDQRVALPSDSYLIDYFNNLDDYLHTGPPAYFVVRNMDFSQIHNQDYICALGNSTCHKNSMLNYLRARAMRPDDYYLTGSVSSFLDDYIMFLRNAKTDDTIPDPLCCGLDDTGSYCNSDTDFCNICDVKLNSDNRPDPEEFYKWLPVFLNSTVNGQCALVGSPYQGEIQLREDGTIEVARFRVFHTILKSQSDYVTAVDKAYKISDGIEYLDVFPYSIFYVFFEQYLYIVKVAWQSMLLAALAVMVVTSLVLLNPILSIIIVSLISLILVDVMGFSELLSVHLNAVSVVNFCMALGISIEFVAHISYAFLYCDGPRHLRVAESVTEMGTSVFMGITLTKLAGVIVLGFSKSKLFRVYYFRIYLMIVLFGGLHGLVLLPVLLSIFGPPRHIIRSMMEMLGLRKRVGDSDEEKALLGEKAVNADDEDDSGLGGVFDPIVDPDDSVGMQSVASPTLYID